MKGFCFKPEYRFLMRTVLVDSKGLETAIQRLDMILKEDLILKRVKEQSHSEKPSATRNRVNLERSKRIYTREMNRKVSFVMRKNRFDPFLV